MAPMNRARAHGSAAAADEALAPPLAGLAREGGKAGERGDLLAVEGPSSGSSAIRVRAMTGPTPGTEASRSSFSRQAGEPRTASSISVSTLASSFSSALSSRAMLFLQPLGRRPLLALPLGDDHLDDLAAAGDEIGQELGRLVGQRPRLGLGRLGEVGDHGGIDRVGLGALAKRLGEGADLGRIDDDHRQPGGGQCRRHDGLEAAGGLQRDDHAARAPSAVPTSRSRPARCARRRRARRSGARRYPAGPSKHRCQR